MLLHWIINAGIGKINMEDYLNDLSAMKSVSNGFSKRSNGILVEAIGAIDGWLVRIGKPSMYRDGQKNPTSFFSRKGFYALNVQVIVDDKKGCDGFHILIKELPMIPVAFVKLIYI